MASSRSSLLSAPRRSAAGGSLRPPAGIRSKARNDYGGDAVTDRARWIGDIRRALGAARDAVQTVRGRGYRLAAERRSRCRAPRGAAAVPGDGRPGGPGDRGHDPLVAARRPAGCGRAAGGHRPDGGGAAVREPVRARPLGPAGARPDRGGDRRPRREFLDLRAGRRHHSPARRGDAAGGREGARGRPRRHRHRPGRGRARARDRRARRRRHRQAALGQAVGRADRRPPRHPGGGVRGAGRRARRPLLGGARPRRPPRAPRRRNREPARLRAVPARHRAQAGIRRRCSSGSPRAT